MNEPSQRPQSVLMIAYTNYSSDPRVIREAEAAVSGGFDVDFLALRKPGEPAIEMVRGVRVIHVNQARFRGRGRFNYVLAYLAFFLRCLFTTTSLHLKKRYRVIHVNNMPDFLVFCTLFAKLMGAKVILDIHDPMPETFSSKFKSEHNTLIYKLLLWQEQLSGWYVDSIVTVSDPLRDQILLGHGLRPEKIHVIANFADEQLFQLQPAPDLNGNLRMVFHGTILRRYGLAELMKGLSQVKNRKRISMKIIGEGDFAAELKAMIASLNLGDMVNFDNRVYPLQQIPAMLADCNLGLVPVLPSTIANYALPLKLLEYTSLGLPVVTVRSIAIGHYFGLDDCLYYQPDDPNSLPVLLDRIVDNPNLLVQYREKTITLREKFLWGGEKKKYIALLRDLALKR